MLWGLIKPNDWKIIHKEKGTYSTELTRKFNAPNKDWYCYLSYSPSRNKYKITNSFTDYDPDWIEESTPYQKCLDKKIELESKN